MSLLPDGQHDPDHPESSQPKVIDALTHLEVLRADARDEIKRRIAQRDTFSIQLILAITTSLAIAAAGGDTFIRILLAIPLAVAFFVMMILYSYRIHDQIVTYLRWEIEPRIASLVHTPRRLEWETYYGVRKSPGIRRRFYRWVLILSSLGFPLTVAAAESLADRIWGFYFWLSVALAIVYLAATAFVVQSDKTAQKSLTSYLQRNAIRDRGTKRRFRDIDTSRAVFIDRDGTIIEDTGYPHDPEDIEIIPGALEAISKLSNLGIRVNVVTNQPGIALGMYGVGQARSMNQALRKAVKRAGGVIDAIYFCPDDEELSKTGYPSSPCIKPNPGMLEDAAADQDLDLGTSYMIGDKQSDVIAGASVGAITFLVKTGMAGSDIPAVEIEPDYEVSDLREAAEVIRELERA